VKEARARFKEEAVHVLATHVLEACVGCCCPLLAEERHSSRGAHSCDPVTSLPSAGRKSCVMTAHCYIFNDVLFRYNLYWCIPVFIYTFIYAFFYLFLYLFIYVYIYLSIYLFIPIFLYSFIHLFKHLFIPVFIYSFMHLFVYSYIYSCIYFMRLSCNQSAALKSGAWPSCLLLLRGGRTTSQRRRSSSQKTPTNQQHNNIYNNNKNDKMLKLSLLHPRCKKK